MSQAAVTQLSSFVTRIRRYGLRSLSDDELIEFGRSYRRAGALLSRARTAGLSGGDVAALNRLLASAYSLLTVPPRRKVGSAVEFLVHEFPRAFRREIRVIMLAAAIFFIGALIGLAVALLSGRATEMVVGTRMQQAFNQVAERHVDNRDWMPETMRPVASIEIMTNNIKVAFLAFASGVMLCLGSFYVLLYNGIILGAIGVVVHQRGVDAAFWGFVAPHGVVEIPAILISAAAGLIIGYGVIAPGRLPRLTALREASRRAVPLLIGVVLMLMEAGLVEGFLSPRVDIEPQAKMIFGLVIFCGLCAWLLLAGRHEAPSESPGALPL